MLNNIGERAKYIRTKFDLSKKEFAAKLSISNSFVSEIENNAKRPGFLFMQRVIEVFQVNLNWLVTGKGEIFLQEEKEKIDLDDFGEQTQNIKELLQTFKNSPLVQMTVLSYASIFLLSNEEIIRKDIEKHRQKNRNNPEKGKKDTGGTTHV